MGVPPKGDLLPPLYNGRENRFPLGPPTLVFLTPGQRACGIAGSTLAQNLTNNWLRLPGERTNPHRGSKAHQTCATRNFLVVGPERADGSTGPSGTSGPFLFAEFLICLKLPGRGPTLKKNVSEVSWIGQIVIISA